MDSISNSTPNFKTLNSPSQPTLAEPVKHSHRNFVSKLSGLALVLASVWALTGCGKMQFTKNPLASLPADGTGGDGGGGGGTIPSDVVTDVILSLHTNNSPADGETANVILVKAVNKVGNPISGFTPHLGVETDVIYYCLSSNNNGVSVCFLKSKTVGTSSAAVTDTLAAATAGSREIDVTFGEKKTARPGYSVAGGSTLVSSGAGAVTVSTVGEATTPIVLNDPDTGFLRALTNMIGAAFESL